MLKEDLINLFEANHQINMASVHSVSSNNSFKCNLNAKSVSASAFVARVMWTYKDDVNWASGEKWKEPSSTISLEAPFNGDTNEETFNINKTFWQ